MHIGVYLGHEAVQYGALRSIARAADDGGYHSVWTSEHVVVPTHLKDRYPYSSDGEPKFRRDQSFASCMATLAHVAAVTSRVRLATCVVPMTAHHPLALAKEAAVVDQLSAGRLELGIGAGWPRRHSRLP
jgi:alkanesulfonate monooxygenase SsuD/methylene tetrahydromethanopterin reductase-like flavin-dependent oxidoreductase (luciferase family)